MRICIILGTRPEIIKMSPIMRELQRRASDFFILHTGQHYSPNMDEIFFQTLGLPQPKYNLQVGSGSHAKETGKMLMGIEEILISERPDVVLVQGDTNSVLAGALAAAKLHIRVGHVEAGLRSNDRSMPEELNRILTDHLSDYLFVPTQGCKSILKNEGIPEEKIFNTGNTIVDAVYQNLEIARSKSDILDILALSDNRYMLITAHRAENVDEKDRLKRLFTGFQLVHEEFGVPIIYPIHPRTRKQMKTFGVTIPSGVTLLDPLGYLDFLMLEAHASLILTDSGGIQEEACILKIPCVTLRENTERPETLEAGGSVLAGTDPKAILDCARSMASMDRNWANPFGEGTAGKRILDIIASKLENRE